MHIQDQRLRNRRVVKKQVCKQCFGPLVEKYVDGEEIVVCAADSTHAEFVSEHRATNIRKLQQRQTHEVLQNYPQFKPEPLQESAQESIDSLYL